MFGTPIAALDVVLGITGQDNVMRGLRQLDREMRAQSQYRNPQQIVPGRQMMAQVENARAMSRAFGTGAGAVGNYQRALDRLSVSLNRPTRNYSAAREAERQIIAAQRARAQIRQAEGDVSHARTVRSLRSADVGIASGGVTTAVGGLRLARSDLATVISQEQRLAQAFGVAEQAAKKEAATLTRLRAQQVGDINKVSTAERALLKQQHEIAALQVRQSAPTIQDEFAQTVTGSKLYEREAKLIAASKDASKVQDEITRHLNARAAAHQIVIDKMIRQEDRYTQAVRKAETERDLTAGAIRAQRGTALAAIQQRNVAGGALQAFAPSVAAARTRVSAAEAALANARLNRQNAINLRQQAGAAVDVAVANARALSARLAPVIAEGGAAAVSRFNNAMRGLNPLQWVAGVFGSIVDVGKSAFGMLTGAVSNVFGGIMSLGTLGFNVIKGGLGIVTGLGRAFLGVAGFVGQAASGVMSFLAMPIISAPLTGGLSLIVQHFDDIIRLAGLAGAAVLAFAAQQVISQGMTYEASLSGVRAAAGYSPGMGNNPGEVEKEMQRLSPIILRIGADTKYNNAEVAKGIETLLSGGLKIQQINMLTARSLFDVASATSSSVEDSAKVIDATVQLFKVPEDQIVHAGDIIAGVVNSSLMDMAEFGSALRQLGPLATTMGISFEDTATALTVLAGAGFRGEIGGTALRNMLIYLNPRSDKAASELKDVGLIDANGKNQFFDSKGQLKGFEEIFALLRQASAGMSDEDQLQFFTKVFGTRSASAGMVYAGLDPSKYGQTKARIGQQSASGTANTRLDNVAGRIEILTGSLQSFAAIIFMNWLKSPLNGMLDFMIKNVNKLLDFAGATDGLTSSYKALFGEQSRLNAFVGLLGQFLTAGNFSNSEDFIAGLREIFAMGGTGRLMDLLPFIKNVEPWIRKATRALQLGRDTVITFAQAWRGEWGGALTQSINPLVRVAGIFGTYWGKIWGAITDLLSGKVSLGQFLGELSGAFGDLLLQLGTLVDTEGPGVIEHFKELGKYLKALGTSWWKDYLQPEVDFLWGKLEAWLIDKKPKMIAMWNDLWNSALGITPPMPENPDFGISALGTNDKGVGADPATSLGRVINTLFDNATDLVRDKVKPMLDEVTKALKAWWEEHHAEVELVGNNIGLTIGESIINGIRGALGHGFSILGDTTNKAWQAAWEKMFPGTFKKNAAGQILLDDKNEPILNTDNGGAGGNRVGQFFSGVGRKAKEALDNAVPLKPGMKGYVDPNAPPPPPPPGTVPPITNNASPAIAAAEAIKAHAAMMAAAMAAAMVPRQININGTGLTPDEFYQQLASKLETFFSGKTAAPQMGGSGGGGGGGLGFTP